MEEARLTLRVQIIDTYFGNMTAEFAFRSNVAIVQMQKTAEDFLEEYQGLSTQKPLTIDNGDCHVALLLAMTEESVCRTKDQGALRFCSAPFWNSQYQIICSAIIT